MAAACTHPSPLRPSGAVCCYDKRHENGVIVRAVQRPIRFCPPPIIAALQADARVDRFARCLELATAWVEAGMPAG